MTVAQDVTLVVEKPLSLRGILIWRQLKKVEVKGIVNMTQGLIELLATAPGGKEHESIFVISCNPSLFHTSLLLIGLNPGGGTFLGGKTAIYGDKVYVYIRWSEKNQTYTRCAEDFVWDKKRNCAMKRVQWSFTGSRFRNTPDGKKVFMANVNSVLVATYYDPDAILNNPLPERGDDTVYYVNESVIPSRGTILTVIFSATPLKTNFPE
jgi:hypothetical protein